MDKTERHQYAMDFFQYTLEIAHGKNERNIDLKFKQEYAPRLDSIHLMAQLLVASTWLEELGELMPMCPNNEEMNTSHYYWDDLLTLKLVRNAVVHNNGDLKLTNDFIHKHSGIKVNALDHVKKYLDQKHYYTMPTRSGKSYAMQKGINLESPFTLHGSVVRATPRLGEWLKNLIIG